MDPGLVILDDEALAVGDGHVKVVAGDKVPEEASLCGLDDHRARMVLGSGERGREAKGRRAAKRCCDITIL